MTGVIYARYSSDSQREESIEGQLRECMAYAERSGITIIGNYIDRAMSARTADRPDFQRMINDSEKHLFDAIIVWKLDRFSRDRYDSATYKHILKKNGVKVISATENISDSPEGILLESLLEGLSEYYSAELSVKIQRGQMENAMKGKNNGGTVPLGLRKGPDGVMELDLITAPIVQEIFRRYDSGESMTAIVTSLNTRGIRTAKGLPFRIGSLGTVLKNRKYIGEYRYGRIVIPDKLPVIIDVELFDRVQRRMEVNRHAPARAKADEEYLLTTKLFCGHCGRMLAGESGRSRNGEVHHYYKCGGAKRKQGCTLKAVKKRWIERTVVTATIARVLRDEVIDRIADALVAYQDKESTLLPSLKQQLKECEKSIQNMLNAIEAGIITPSTKQRLQDLEARREELNVSILQEQLQKPKFTREQIVAWISRFKYGDPDDLEYQKQIIDNFVNSVYVYDDRLVMTYNYKDGTETISLDAVHQAFGSDLASDAPLHKKIRTFTVRIFCYRWLILAIAAAAGTGAAGAVGAAHIGIHIACPFPYLAAASATIAAPITAAAGAALAVNAAAGGGTLLDSNNIFTNPLLSFVNVGGHNILAVIHCDIANEVAQRNGGLIRHTVIQVKGVPDLGRADVP